VSELKSHTELGPLYDNGKSGLLGRIAFYRRNLVEYSHLFKQLTIVDITNVYKRSFIGLSWLVLTPIIAVIVWILLNGAGIFEPGDTVIPYPAYVLLSTSIWSFFQGAYMVASNVIIKNGRFMVTAKFPHEVIVAQQMVLHSINFVIPFLINIIVLLIYGVKFSWIAILFPLTLIPLLFLGTALGLIVALMRVVAVDFSRLADHAIAFLMFLTPIVYAPKISVGWLSDIIKVNPLTYLVGFSRDLLTTGVFTQTKWYMIVSLASLIVFVICFRLFMKYESKLLERLINV